MQILMYMSKSDIEEYKKGGIARGVSEEGRVDYPYMRILVSVPDVDVIGIEEKTIPVYDADERKTGKMRTFMSYDVQKVDE